MMEDDLPAYPTWSPSLQWTATIYNGKVYMIHDHCLYENWRTIVENIDHFYVMTHLPEYLMEILL